MRKRRKDTEASIVQGQPAELLYMGSTPIPGSMDETKTYLMMDVDFCINSKVFSLHCWEAAL